VIAPTNIAANAERFSQLSLMPLLPRLPAEPLTLPWPPKSAKGKRPGFAPPQTAGATRLAAFDSIGSTSSIVSATR
jgi:hypothetical protein